MEYRRKEKLNRSEMHLVGLSGTPYYLATGLYTFQMAQISGWFWLLIVPMFALYDRTSQLSYFKWVRSSRIGKVRFIAASLAIQALFFAALFGATHGAKYVINT